MIAAYLMILTENLPEHIAGSYFFSRQKGQRSIQVHFYLGLSSFFVTGPMRIEAQTAQKPH